MTVATAMLLGAVGAGILLPGWLNGMSDRFVSPSIVIAGWLSGILGVLTSAMLGVLLLLVPGHGVPGGALAAVGACWSSIRHGVPPRVEEVAGVAGILVLLAMMLRLLVIGRTILTARVQDRRRRLSVLRLAARVQSGTPPILWLAHDRPLAFALAGRPSYLIATDGLVQQLTVDQLAAVLEHERAHLRHRHHLMLGFVDVVSSAFPFVPMFREAPNVLRTLVELAADDVAAGRYGREALRGALQTVGSTDGPAGSLAFGRDAIEIRVQRLAAASRPVGWARRGAAGCIITGASVMPVVAATVLFAASSLFFCSGG